MLRHADDYGEFERKQAEYFAVTAKKGASWNRNFFTLQIADTLRACSLDPAFAERALRPHLLQVVQWVLSLPTNRRAAESAQRCDFDKGKHADVARITIHNYTLPAVNTPEKRDALYLQANYLDDSHLLVCTGSEELYDCADSKQLEFWRNPWWYRVKHLGKAEPIASDSVADARIVQEIKERLRIDGKVLIGLGTSAHAVFVELEKGSGREGSYTLRIYNSGLGLDHHQRRGQKYDLVFQVTGVPWKEGVDGLNDREIYKLFTKIMSRDMKYLYDWVKRKGVRDLNRVNQMYGKDQDGPNCTIEAIHAYLANHLERQVYKQLRIINLALILYLAYSSECHRDRFEGAVASDRIAGPEDLVVILGMLDGKIRKYQLAYG